jgi:hypothetical protein
MQILHKQINVMITTSFYLKKKKEKKRKQFSLLLKNWMHSFEVLLGYESVDRTTFSTWSAVLKMYHGFQVGQNQSKWWKVI